MTRSNDFKEQDKSLRKQMVIDAAIKIFHQKGYRSATLEDVAQDLGLTKPALYNYVSSKENLLSQIYIQAMESFFSYIYEIPSLELSPKEKMRLFIRRHLKAVVIENLAMFSVFFSEENQLAPKDFQRIRKEKLKFTKVVEGIIEEGMAQGYFRPVNAKLQANAIIGMCNWLYRWYRPGRSSFTPEEIAEQFILLIEGGLMSPRERGDGVPVDSGTGTGKTAESREKRILRELREASEKVTVLVSELDTKK